MEVEVKNYFLLGGEGEKQQILTQHKVIVQKEIQQEIRI